MNNVLRLLDESFVYLQRTSCIWVRQLEVVLCMLLGLKGDRRKRQLLTKDIDGSLVHNMEKHKQVHSKQTERCQGNFILRFVIEGLYHNDVSVMGVIKTCLGTLATYLTS